MNSKMGKLFEPGTQRIGCPVFANWVFSTSSEVHEPPLTVRSLVDFAILDTQYPPSFDLFGQQLVARLTPVVRL